jgi:hypothetical protein
VHGCLVIPNKRIFNRFYGFSMPNMGKPGLPVANPFYQTTCQNRALIHIKQLIFK